jgi:major membrane immunogen (membrane-anchored lipoprotein)
MIQKRYFISCFFVLLFFSCADGEFSLKDGYYTAEAAEFDTFGWKEYVTICVSLGRIIAIEYNAFNPSGFIKSWDMNYMRVMNAGSGTYPTAYARAYTSQLLAGQGTDGVEYVTGATASYYSFLRLAEAALENARQGDSATRLVYIKNAGGNGDGPRAAH